MKIIVDFADSQTLAPHAKESVDQFMANLDKYGAYVFEKNGWVAKMTPDLLEFIQPPSLKNDMWWSTKSLLQAIRNQIQFPQPLHQGMPFF